MILYNDNDEGACRWLHELVNAGAIPEGDIWCRDIREIEPHELTDYTQVHFFAGIGGWAYALELAGWDSGRPVWTGSCPCQPFSAAGRQQGHEDERHLWPAFFRLTAECRPPVVLGEQVASKLGRDWLVGVFADLETVGYATAGADLCAAGVGAPHIRQRLWWVADAESGDREVSIRERRQDQAGAESRGRSGVGGLGDAVRERGSAGPTEPQSRQGRDAEKPIDRSVGSGAWADTAWIPCAGGKARRIEPGLEPLVNGLPGRVGLLRGYGNAITPQVAAAFVKAYSEAIGE